MGTMILANKSTQKPQANWRQNLVAKAMQLIAEGCMSISIDTKETKYYKSAPISLCFANESPDVLTFLHT
ncbi:hypothetical protein [Nitrosomonas sp. Is37]|uniref:hypothetical protein n=1 Tax=Nitrosomonas sp. Is37 TaxID=3080535 RepID=UPI00294B2A6E|nr:hypothetical protein [Nitrosomonas sp. Is37]